MAKPTDKICVGLIFGGRSCEHEVSVVSARAILAAIPRDRFQISLIGIDKQGHWHLGEAPSQTEQQTEQFEKMLRDGVVRDRESAAHDLVALDLHHHGNLRAITALPPLPKLDVVFPALHGSYGEDGAIQGALEMAGMPYVGCGVAASALAMDKALVKKVFANADLPQAAYMVVSADQWQHDAAQVAVTCQSQLGYPLFVKPANAGSSIGISRVQDPNGLNDAIGHAFAFDRKLVIEQAVQDSREIECAILGNISGNASPEASVLGEIIPSGEFYDYATKYLDDTSQLIVPADLPETVTQQVREFARRAFVEIDGSGLARVDFFVRRNTHQIILNEVNTLPGFTPISMYPRLWQASGVAYDALITRLLELALQRQQNQENLRRSHS